MAISGLNNRSFAFKPLDIVLTETQTLWASPVGMGDNDFGSNLWAFALRLGDQTNRLLRGTQFYTEKTSAVLCVRFEKLGEKLCLVGSCSAGVAFYCGQRGEEKSQRQDFVVCDEGCVVSVHRHSDMAC